MICIITQRIQSILLRAFYLTRVVVGNRCPSLVTRLLIRNLKYFAVFYIVFINLCSITYYHNTYFDHKLLRSVHLHWFKQNLFRMIQSNSFSIDKHVKDLTRSDSYIKSSPSMEFWLLASGNSFRALLHNFGSTVWLFHARRCKNYIMLHSECTLEHVTNSLEIHNSRYSGIHLSDSYYVKIYYLTNSEYVGCCFACWIYF